ncbi:MAG: site-specific integrase [Parasphingorhabdus sp.]
MKYRFGGKEKRLALGSWPEISLAKARELRDDARRKIAEGIDPAMERKKEKAAAKLGAENTFSAIAEEYIETKMVKEGRADATIKKARWFLDLLKPAIGQMPITEVDLQMLLTGLRKLEARGNYETAKKSRSFASRVFRYGVWTGRCQTDPASTLQGALTSVKATHYAAILEPKKFGEFLRAIDEFEGQPVTKIALRIAPHVFLRPGELRGAEWPEIKLEDATWHVPAGRMKNRYPHTVPLSTQVIGMLTELRNLDLSDGYVFPSFYTPNRPISENTMNVAFRRMGFGKEEVTSHGLRASASTFLNESRKWQKDAIERALSHKDQDAVRAAYNRGSYWDERVEMAQWWSDYLDGLRIGN